jgi:hypothetical protein
MGVLGGLHRSRRVHSIEVKRESRQVATGKLTLLLKNITNRYNGKSIRFDPKIGTVFLNKLLLYSGLEIFSGSGIRLSALDQMAQSEHVDEWTAQEIGNLQGLERFTLVLHCNGCYGGARGDRRSMELVRLDDSEMLRRDEMSI